jgi:hypothetical protein
MINRGKWMKQWNWVKSAFFRLRDARGAVWDRLQKESPISENVEMPVWWSDLITFSHCDVHPRAYMGRLMVLSGDQGFGNRKNAPIPPQHSRFMICTDDDMFGGDPKEQTPKTESTDSSTSSSDESPMVKPVKADFSNEGFKPAGPPLKNASAKEEPRDLSPVGLMARDPDGSNPFEIVLDSAADVEVHEHGPIAIHPNERVTMGRKHRIAVLDGISNLNKHDMMIESGLGLISDPSHDSLPIRSCFSRSLAIP